MKVCTKCKTEKSLLEFRLEKKRGEYRRRADCVSCVSERQKTGNRVRYSAWLEKTGQLKSVPCDRCGIKFPPHVMDFDHRNPSEKLGDVSRSYGRNPVWQQAEIQKCDVVCACCHRLRTSTLTKTGRKRQLLRDLKARPCADCGGSFHYSQMDFDHIRGEKIGALANLTGMPLAVLLAEAAKCDVVCANCHRERTHQRKFHPPSVVSELPPQEALRPWQELAGTMEDQAVAAFYGIPREEVWAYRKECRIPVYKQDLKPRWQHLVGTMPDSEVAKIGGVIKSTVGHYRRRVGVPAFVPSAKKAA